MRIGTTADLTISSEAEEIFHLWQNLPRAENQILPKRIEFDLESLPSHLAEHTFILSRMDENVLSITDSGGAIQRFLGINITGQNLYDQRTEEQKKLEKRYYDSILSHPCAGMMARRTKNISGDQATFNSIHLPMLDYKEEPTYLLGVASITDREVPEEENSLHVFGSSSLLDQALIDIGAGIPTFGQ